MGGPRDKLVILAQKKSLSVVGRRTHVSQRTFLFASGRPLERATGFCPLPTPKNGWANFPVDLSRKSS